MARNDALALKRMAKYGYKGSKVRDDNCKGCHHSTPYAHGQKGTLNCRQLGMVVASGAKCDKWVSRGTDLGLKSISQGVHMDTNTEVPQSIYALAAAGVTKMRKVVWVNKMDHVSISITGGKPGIWTKLHCPMNVALSGEDPLSIIWYQMDFDKVEWVAYTGPDAESAEYLAERDRCTELMSSSGNFRGPGNAPA